MYIILWFDSRFFAHEFLIEIIYIFWLYKILIVYIYYIQIQIDIEMLWKIWQKIISDYNWIWKANLAIYCQSDYIYNLYNITKYIYYEVKEK